MGEGPSVSRIAPAVARLALVVLLVAAAAACGSEEPASSSSSTGTTFAAVATTSTSAGADGTPVAVGTPVDLGADGTAVVTQMRRIDAINQRLLTGNFLLVTVRVEATGDARVPYSPDEWTLVTDDGVSIDALALADEGRLSFGTLEPGQQIEGDVAFDLGDRAPSGAVHLTPRAGPGAAWTVPSFDVTPSTAGN